MNGLLTMDTTVEVDYSRFGLMPSFDAPNAITVIIPTYGRIAILRQTLRLLHEHLLFDGSIRYLVSEDFEDFYDVHFGYDDVQYLQGPRRGLGANLNFLLGKATTDVVLQMDDDHWLESPLDINRYVQDLRDGRLNIGWIRLFIGEHDDMYNAAGYYKFKAANYGPYWFLDVDSPELYIASCRPHLKLRSFHDEIGYYRENLKLGETESMFCHEYKNAKRGQPWDMFPWVVIPMVGIQWDQWSHVGDSLQAKGY